MAEAKKRSMFSLLLSKRPTSLNRDLRWVEIVLADSIIKSFPFPDYNSVKKKKSFPFPIHIMFQ